MAEKNETTKVRLTKEKKEKAIKSDKVNPLVLDSLTSALESSLPVVLTESTPAPKVTNKKSNKMKLPNLLRPLSPGFRSDSDESPTSPRRWHSPHFRRKKPKARHGLRIKSADSSPVKDAEDSSTTPPPDDLETTQVASLPGQVEVNSKDSKTSLELPTILVSPDEEDGCELMRKTSQSSHLSVSSSIVTSGVEKCNKLYVSVIMILPLTMYVLERVIVDGLWCVKWKKNELIETFSWVKEVCLTLGCSVHACLL